MTDTSFIRVKLSGGRFRDGELPFFILGDLEHLQNMIIDVAKGSYKSDNDRRRSPSHFDQTYLKITGLGSGSVVVEIGIEAIRPILNVGQVPDHKHFETAINNIVDVIDAATQDPERVSACLPSHYMGYFNRIGRSLSDKETMEITVPGKRPAHLTRQSREILVRHAVNEIMKDITIRGKISEADQKNMKFRLEPIHGTNVPCSFLESHRETVIDALDSYSNSQDRDRIRVRVQGTGIYDKYDNLQRVDPVKNVEPLDILDVRSRLDEFRNMQDGWLDGNGIPPDHAGLDWLSDAFETYYPDDLQLPRACPMVDGNINLEWSSKTQEVEIEVDLKNHLGEWYTLNKDTKVDSERQLKLDEPNDWSWACEKIREIMGRTET